MVQAEFHRPLQVGRVGSAGLEIEVTADAAELAGLAARLRVGAVHGLRCRFALSRAAAGVIEGQGWLVAEIEQVCVVSLDPFPATVSDEFRVRFVPADEVSESLEPDALDEIGYAGDVLDLGEAAAEQLALVLDPYPRKPGVAFEEAEADAPRAAFEALEQLRRQH